MYQHNPANSSNLNEAITLIRQDLLQTRPEWIEESLVNSRQSRGSHFSALRLTN